MSAKPGKEETGLRMNGFVTIASAKQGTPFVEAYGLLLASVLLGSSNGGGKPPSVVAVVGAQEGDGTSTTALNLALMMARTGRPTVLVDANMRAPELHKAFGLPQSPGLAEVLTAKAEFKTAIVPTGVPNLSLVPSGSPNVPAQALLSQPALGDFIGILRGRFDLVVIDTSPILKYSDALHMAKCADGVLLVVSAQGASRHDQQETRRLLERVNAHVLGTVLNRVRARTNAPMAPVP
jgi:capsular exopolysaccharide synthesis family protein